MPYRLSSLAERDLDEIWLYVAEEASPTTADRLIVDIVDRFDLMAEQRGPSPTDNSCSPLQAGSNSRPMMLATKPPRAPAPSMSARMRARVVPPIPAFPAALIVCA